MSTTASSISTPTPAPRRLSWLPAFDTQYVSLLLVTFLLLAVQTGYGLLESFSRTGLAIFTCVATEIVLSKLILNRWPRTASAYMSGVSVGILIRSPAFWPYAMCSLLTIVSKYALRCDGRHVFNPSNLGVSAMLLLAPTTVASLSIQWGNELWPMFLIWMIGLMTTIRVHRFHICATYVVSFIGFAFLRSGITGDPFLTQVAPLTGPMYQLYVFFMITDPKTNVRSRWGQYVVAFLIAFVEMLLRLNRVVHAPYYALFLVGPTAFMIEIWWTRRQAARAREREPRTEPESEPVTAPAAV